ncbi:hypothetical protein MRX96_027201 [Rhipicephalus microplus]
MSFLVLMCLLLGTATGTRTVYPMVIEERTDDGSLLLLIHHGLTLSLTKAKVATELLHLRSSINGTEMDQIVNGTDIERSLFEDRQKNGHSILNKFFGRHPSDWITEPYRKD